MGMEKRFIAVILDGDARGDVVDDRGLKIQENYFSCVAVKRESGKWKKLNGQFMACHFHTISAGWCWENARIFIGRAESVL